MKAYVQTRIIVGLTPEEARVAVNNAVDLQLCVRSALYQIDGMPVATLIEQNRKQLPPPKRHKRKQLAAPKRRKPFEKRECIHCHQPYSISQIGKHERTCKARPTNVTA